MIDYAAKINAVMAEFKVNAVVTGEIEGSSIIRYELGLGPGVRVETVERLRKNLAYSLAVDSVRLAQVPGKSALGIELPRGKRDTVRLEDVPVTDSHPLTVALGKGLDGPVTLNLAKMPHLLVSGTTGSGKSSFINGMLVSLLKRSPEHVQLVLIDPKQVELAPYNSVPHLARPVATETPEAVEALEWLVDTMEDRYKTMQAAGVRHADALHLPYIVCVIDELADLVLSDKSVEPLIIRLTQKARAAGIVMVLATQRPSVDVVTGLLKSNVPSRLAFAAASAIDSGVILGCAGAEQLLGAGDALYMPIGAKHPARVQGVLVTDREVADAVDAVRVTAQVEDMVEQLHPDPLEEQGPTVLDYLNTLIQNAETAGNRAEALVNKFCKPKGLFNRGGKTEILVEMPNELDRAAEALRELAQGLAIIRDQALVDA